MFTIKKHNYADIIEGMIIGGSIAAMTTYMFGTKKGKKLQKDFIEKVEQLRANAKREVGKTKVRKAKRKIKKAAASKVKTLRRKATKKIARKIGSTRRKAAR